MKFGSLDSFNLTNKFRFIYSGLRIDRLNGVQMELDRKNRFSGTAILAFKHSEDYEKAIKIKLLSINP